MPRENVRRPSQIGAWGAGGRTAEDANLAITRIRVSRVTRAALPRATPAVGGVRLVQALFAPSGFVRRVTHP